MRDNWTCGCSMLGGHICGKQDKPIPSIFDIPDFKIGDRVKCIRQHPGSLSGSFDGDSGVLIEIDVNSDQPFRVVFESGYSPQIRWCHEIIKV